jgi:hypothetical protein
MIKVSKKSLLVLLFIPIWAASVFAQQMKADPVQARTHDLIHTGTGLSHADAEILEAQLEVQPDNLTIRTKLLGYYFAGGKIRPRSKLKLDTLSVIEARRKHIFWIIENRPEHPVAGDSAATLDPSGHPLADKTGYIAGKNLWLERTKERADNPAILGNAARFLQLHDKELAQDLLNRAALIEPGNSQWPRRLGYLHALVILGVNGLNHNGLPTSFNQQEVDGEFAQATRASVANCTNAYICGTAGKILFQYGLMLQAVTNRELEPDTLELAEQALNNATKLQPEINEWKKILAEFNEMKQLYLANRKD